MKTCDEQLEIRGGCTFVASLSDNIQSCQNDNTERQLG